ncbi:MAG: hypothetical protein U1D55_18470 [Phycisphaerae bacterium]
MNPSELVRMLVEALTQHIPASAAWAPPLAMSAVTLFGLVLLLHGAKLAPALTALAFAGVGGVSASFLAHAMNLPLWPTIACGGVVSLIVGFVLFRIWMAGILACCFAVAGVGVYFVRTLHPYVAQFVSGDGSETVLPAGAAENVPPMVHQLGQLWTHLSSNVPGFQAQFGTIVGATMLAGLAFGLLLPKFARSVWAATFGTLTTFVGTCLLLDAYWPSAMQALANAGAWGGAIVATVWLLSLVYNLSSGKRARRVETPAEAAPAPTPLPASR